MASSHRFAFRVDGCPAIGAGHLHRCLNLARVLADQGADIRFLVRPHAYSLHELLGQAGFEVRLLPPPDWPVEAAHSAADHGRWLGKPAHVDADETLALLAPESILVVDHYGVDGAWLERLGPAVTRLAIFDDMANRPLAKVQLVINSLPEMTANHYAALVVPGVQLLLGASYVPLGSQWREARRDYRFRAPLHQVLFCPGGTDPFSLSECLLPHLAQATPDLVYHLALHAPAHRRRQLSAALGELPNVRCHFHLDELSGLAAGMDLAIGNAGSGCWERACLGLPQIAIRTTPDQTAIASFLSRQSLALVLDKDEPDLKDKLLAALCSLRESSMRRRQMAELGSQLVDGLGCHRLAQALCP